jgi:hypothetical protein
MLDDWFWFVFDAVCIRGCSLSFLLVEWRERCFVPRHIASPPDMTLQDLLSPSKMDTSCLTKEPWSRTA